MSSDPDSFRPTDDTSPDEKWLAHVVGLAVSSVSEDGGPFGAAVVRDGVLVADGHNRVTLDLDPTAHAEVVAIRSATRRIGDFSLAGCTLYSSCEPCPMCLASALWARVDRIVFAADRHDAARGGFDDRAFHELFARDRTTWETAVEHHRLPGSYDPFEAWLRRADRTHY